MKKFLTFLLVLLAAASLSAQELTVVSFKLKPTDLKAKLNPRLDLNGDPAALIRVQVAAPGCLFKGNIVGEVQNESGEYLVYMAKGSRHLRIYHNEFLFTPLDYEIPERIKPNCSYELKLEVPIYTHYNEILNNQHDKEIKKVKKQRPAVDPTWLLQPAVSFANNQIAYGVMGGWVKRAGIFLRAKTNFKFRKADEDGLLTGGAIKKRWAFTAGYLQRVIDPLFLYAGAGYGVRQFALETTGGYVPYPSDEFSNKGIEVELGAILRLGKFALSAGVQTNSFKYYEANVGVGFMF